MSKKLNGVFERIRKLAVAQAGRWLSDRDLIQRFYAGADESAFTAPRRETRPAGPWHVPGVLVLARKASSLQRRMGLGGWLQGVLFEVLLAGSEPPRDSARKKE